MTKAQKQERFTRAKDALLDPVNGYGIKAGDTIHTILRHVSKSGMSRSISCVLIRDGENVQLLDHWLAMLLDYRIDQGRGGGLKVSGCGMDMGYSVIYSLSRALFPVFECLGKGCPSNDHNNGDRDYTPHNHSDGGYALKHRWL